MKKLLENSENIVSEWVAAILNLIDDKERLV